MSTVPSQDTSLRPAVTADGGTAVTADGAAGTAATAFPGAPPPAVRPPEIDWPRLEPTSARAVVAVGRHRAEAVRKNENQRAESAGLRTRSGSRRRRARREPDLALWGVFLGVVAYAGSARTDIAPAAAAGIAVLVMAVFVAAWWFTGPADAPAETPADAPADTERTDRRERVDAPAPAPVPTPVPAPAPTEPAPTATSPAPAPAAARTPVGAESGPPIPVHEGHPLQALPWEVTTSRRGRRRAETGHREQQDPAPSATSRWTRAFGPPETGSLPLQEYVPTGPLPVVTADASAPDRRQRSHSRI